MIDVAAAVEVDERLQGDLGLDVLFLSCFGQLLCEVVEGGYVGLVVLAVVELHDLAGDGGFEGAIVVLGDREVWPSPARRLLLQIQHASRRWEL